MKRFILLLIVALVGTAAIQAREKQEVVLLKNGHKVRGKIVTYAPLDSLVIQEQDGNQQTIYWSQIKKITKENWQPQQSIGKSFTSGVGVQKGYRGFADLEYYLSVDAASKSRMGLSTSHGYQVLPYLYVGAGLGAQFITGQYSFEKKSPSSVTDKKTIVAIPVFADVRLDLTKSKFSPFIDVRAGKTFGNAAFGIMLNPSVGCRMALNDNLALNLSLGYSLQSTDLLYYISDYHIYHINSDAGSHSTSWQNNPYHSLSLRLGVEF